MSLFETKKLGEMAPATKLVVYGLLGLWTVIVLFPLYWVVVTSVKLPIQVSNGPVYLPFIDYQPSLHAWRYIFVDIARDTFRPYLNSLIVAIASTSLRHGRRLARGLRAVALRVPAAASHHRHLHRSAWRSPCSQSHASASTGGWPSRSRWR